MERQAAWVHQEKCPRSSHGFPDSKKSSSSKHMQIQPESCHVDGKIQEGGQGSTSRCSSSECGALYAWSAGLPASQLLTMVYVFFTWFRRWTWPRQSPCSEGAGIHGNIQWGRPAPTQLHAKGRRFLRGWELPRSKDPVNNEKAVWTPGPTWGSPRRSCKSAGRLSAGEVGLPAVLGSCSWGWPSPFHHTLGHPPSFRHALAPRPPLSCPYSPSYSSHFVDSTG